jgi:hypothetical protein
LLRSAYGYTDEQILNHIIEYGTKWIEEAIGFIVDDQKREMEQDVERTRWLIHALPLARTPMDKKGGRAMTQYSKRLLNALDEALPWKAKEKHDAIRKRLKEPPQSVKPRVIE